MPRTRGRPNRPHPPIPLATTLQVAEAIADNNASRPMNRLLLAEAMNFSPNSSGFRERVAASAKYGLTEGNYSSETISLTSLGVAITRPRNEAERIEAKRAAFVTVPLFDDLFRHFTNAKLPGPDFLKNILEREPFNIDPERSAAAAEAFTEDAREVGYLRNIGGSPHLVVDASGTTPAMADHPIGRIDQLDGAPQEQSAPEPVIDSFPTGPSDDDEQPKREPVTRSVPMQLFIGHGPNRKPLEQLKEILNSWKVPFLVAVDEPNARTSDFWEGS